MRNMNFNFMSLNEIMSLFLLAGSVFLVLLSIKGYGIKRLWNIDPSSFYVVKPSKANEQDKRNIKIITGFVCIVTIITFIYGK